MAEQTSSHSSSSSKRGRRSHNQRSGNRGRNSSLMRGMTKRLSGSRWKKTVLPVIGVLALAGLAMGYLRKDGFEDLTDLT